MPKEGVLIDLQRKQQEKGFKEALQKVKDLENKLAETKNFNDVQHIAIDAAQKQLEKYRDEIKDLEQALAKEQAEHAETLKRGNEVDDFYERLEKENELLRKLLKSLL